MFDMAFWIYFEVQDVLIIVLLRYLFIVEFALSVTFFLLSRFVLLLKRFL